MNEQPCYCDSGRPFADCCCPLLDGSIPAATAEALMRSRYTANVLNNSDYLLRTWHSSTRPASLVNLDKTHWRCLVVVKVVKGSIRDNSGTVEFKAMYQHGPALAVLHERSRFIREQDRWYYLDGELSPTDITQQREQPGRNDPCPCGSGKKYKRCCLRFKSS